MIDRRSHLNIKSEGWFRRFCIPDSIFYFFSQKKGGGGEGE